MGFDEDTSAKVSRGLIAIAIALALAGSVPIPFDGATEAAPNPIPVLSLSLHPSQLQAHVTDTELGAVTFGGNATVEQLPLMSCTVTLQAVVNTGWPVVLSPQTLSYTGPGTQEFQVTVIVPPNTPETLTGNVIVSGSAKVPGLAPVVASASSVVTVDLEIIEGVFEIIIFSPMQNATFVEGDILFQGNATYSRGPIEKVQIRLDDGPWHTALGTEDWSYRLNVTGLPLGYHALYVVAHSEYFISNTSMVSFKVELPKEHDRPLPTGGAPEGSMWETFMAIAVVALLILLVVVVLLLTSKQRRDEWDGYD